MTLLQDLTTAAEEEWLAGFTAGPTEGPGTGLPTGATAPDLILPDHTGAQRSLSEFWADRPALVMFWRHFGCGCGVARAERLRSEVERYREAGLNPVIVGQGEPQRAAAYRAEHNLETTILCDPDHVAYRAYGVGHWSIERVLADAPEAFWSHPRELGAMFQGARRETGRPPVDDPWRAAVEFVVSPAGLVRLCYYYQHCEDFPPAQVHTTAARLI